MQSFPHKPPLSLAQSWRGWTSLSEATRRRSGPCPDLQPHETGTKTSQTPITIMALKPDPPTKVFLPAPLGQPCSLSAIFLSWGPPGRQAWGQCPLGFPGSPAWAGFKDSSCGLHPLATGTGRGGTGGPHAQVQPSQPPEKKRGGEAPVPSFPEDSKEVLRDLGTVGPSG